MNTTNSLQNVTRPASIGIAIPMPLNDYSTNNEGMNKTDNYGLFSKEDGVD